MYSKKLTYDSSPEAKPELEENIKIENEDSTGSDEPASVFSDPGKEMYKDCKQLASDAVSFKPVPSAYPKSSAELLPSVSDSETSGTSTSTELLKSKSAKKSKASRTSRSSACNKKRRRYRRELQYQWNLHRVLEKLGTREQCIEFAEEKGLILRSMFCKQHECQMSILQKGQVGMFKCHKKNCKKAVISRSNDTWFENVKIPLSEIFKIMYCFAADLTYRQTQRECCSDDRDMAISCETIAYWFNNCRKTIERDYKMNNIKMELIIEPENLDTKNPGISGDLEKSGRTPTKHESQWHYIKKKFKQRSNMHKNFDDWLMEYTWKKYIEDNHLDPFDELLKSIKNVYNIN